MISYDSEFILSKVASWGDFSEVYEEESEGFVIELFNQNIERCLQTKDKGVSLRTFKQEQVFFTATNYLPLEEIVKAHLKNINYGSMPFSFIEEKIYTENFEFNRNKDESIRLITSLAESIRAEVDNLININILFQRYKKNYAISNTEHKSTKSITVGERIFVNLTVKRAEDKASVYESIGYTFREITEDDIKAIFDNCKKRAAAQKIAKDGPSGIFPVIISASAGGTFIHEAVGHGLEADLVDKGVSIYRGKIGEKVASDKITVVDSSIVPKSWGSFFCDDEGTAAHETMLIEKGFLKNYLYDKYYAFKHNVNSTGNGRRQSYNHKPYPRMTNTYIKPGEDNVFDIIKSIDKGIFVTKMGGGQVNTLTGDFIFEIQDGNMIENGEITYPLKNLSIIGNGPKVLNDIEAVGNDFGTAIGTCGKEGQGVPVGDGQPSLYIPAMTIGGKS